MKLLVDGAVRLFDETLLVEDITNYSLGPHTDTPAKVVIDGLSSGAEMAVLTSSPSGEGIYRALGFREVARWAQWLPEDIEPD